MQSTTCKEPSLAVFTQSEWDAIPACNKDTWTTERTDWPNWDEVRHQYLGKKTLLRGHALWVEGISFTIVPDPAPTETPNTVRIRKRDEIFEGKAEGTVLGLPYQTEICSSAGCSIVFWCGDAFDDELLKAALARAMSKRDIVSASASLGHPTGYYGRDEL